MKKKSRLFNVILNTLFGSITALSNVVINFILRIFIVRYLGVEINGIHTLFQSIINMMSIIESSFNTGFLVHLYKPVQEKNKDKIIKLIRYYKQIYIGIAVVVFIISILISLFILDHVVKSSYGYRYIQFCFLLLASSLSISYFYGYKKNILYATQENRVVSIIMLVSQIICRGISIILICYFEKYVFFLLLIVCEKVLINYFSNKMVERRFNYLQSMEKLDLDIEEKHKIRKTVFHLFVNQSAGAVQNALPSILIGIFTANISYVGYYGNYQLVVGAMNILFSQIGGAITTSLGSLFAENNVDRLYSGYKKCVFTCLIISFVSGSVFLCCIQSFVSLSFGDNHLLSYEIVFLIMISAIMYLMNVPILSLQNALGLHSKDSGLMVCQTILSIVLGWILGSKFELWGVLLGCLIPVILFSNIIKPFIIERYIFKINTSSFFYDIIINFIKGAMIIVSTYYICSSLKGEYLFVDLIVKFFSSIIISFLISLVLYRKENTLDLILAIFRR